MLLRISNKQEQIMLYLYEFRNTPERGVGPDPRVTVPGIAEGTQIQQYDVRRQLRRLADGAFVRPVLVGQNTFYYLTMKGYSHIEKVQHKSFSVGLDRTGISLGFEKSETKGKRAASEWENGE